MKLKARPNEIDPVMIEVYDPVRNMLWFLVHRDFFFDEDGQSNEDALKGGEELNITMEAWPE